MKTTGKIWCVYNEQVISDTFKKREVVLEIAENPEYPQYVKFEFIQDKCDLLSNYSQGQTVDLDFNLNGRIYQDKNSGENKTFTTLQGWKIALNQGEQQPAQQNQPPQQQTSPSQQQQNYQQPPNNNGPY